MRLVCDQKFSARWPCCYAAVKLCLHGSRQCNAVHCRYQWNCNFIQSVIPLFGHHSYRRGGTAQEHCGCLAIRQAAGQYLNLPTDILPSKLSARHSTVHGSTANSVLTVCHWQLDADRGKMHINVPPCPPYAVTASYLRSKLWYCNSADSLTAVSRALHVDSQREARNGWSSVIASWRRGPVGDHNQEFLNFEINVNTLLKRPVWWAGGSVSVSSLSAAQFLRRYSAHSGDTAHCNINKPSSQYWEVNTLRLC